MVAEKIEAVPVAEREPEDKGRNFEVLRGVIIALFAAILAVTDLGGAGDTFDLSTLFLQICLVLGAISLVVQGAGARRSFFLGMIILGLVGSVFTVLAFQQAFAIG